MRAHRTGKIFKIESEYQILKSKIQTKNRNECYCGNAYGSYGTADIQGKSCNMTCTNNTNETCGGGNANSVYQIDLTFFGSTAITTTTSTKTSSSTTTTIKSNCFPKK
jgi:cell wall integrity and stress response component